MEVHGPERPEARTSSVEAEIDRLGYTTVALLQPSEVTTLREVFESGDVSLESPITRTLSDSTRQRASAIDHDVKKLVAPHVEHVMPGHRAVVALFVHKAPGRGSPVAFHQDWSLTDERHDRALMWWIALDDCSEGNGGLAVIPRSHRWTTGVRPHSTVSQPTDPHQEILASRAVQLEVPRGTAVIYHPGIVHGSPPNLSERSRLVALVGTAPRNSRLLHYFESPEGISGWEVNEGFYTDHEHGTTCTSLPAAELWGPVVRSTDLERVLGVASPRLSATTDPYQFVSAARRFLRATPRRLRNALQGFRGSVSP